MSDPVAALVVDLLEWIGTTARPYPEVIEAWRTSCPRLPVWETANEQGLIDQTHVPGEQGMVSLSLRGRELLVQHRAQPSAPSATMRSSASSE